MKTYTYKSQSFSDILRVMTEFMENETYSVKFIDINKEIRENEKEFWYVTFHYERVCPHCKKEISL